MASSSPPVSCPPRIARSSSRPEALRQREGRLRRQPADPGAGPDHRAGGRHGDGARRRARRRPERATPSCPASSTRTPTCSTSSIPRGTSPPRDQADHHRGAAAPGPPRRGAGAHLHRRRHHHRPRPRQLRALRRRGAPAGHRRRERRGAAHDRLGTGTLPDRRAVPRAPSRMAEHRRHRNTASCGTPTTQPMRCARTSPSAPGSSRSTPTTRPTPAASPTPSSPPSWNRRNATA